MGGCISSLQRWILLSCLQNGCLSNKDILCAWFGCEPGEWRYKKGNGCWDEYNKAHASLSRSLSRLRQRNLVRIWKTLNHSATMVTLTDAGKILARNISEEEKEDA